MPLTKKLSKDKTTCKVSFSMPEETVGEAKKLYLSGEFNNWTSAAMRKVKGSFTLSLELPTGASYQYRYHTDQGVWLNDIEADCYVFNTFADTDNSVLLL